MVAIVNVTPDWGIGRENRLLVSLPSDLRRFRALTEGKTVILGSKTLATFPGGRPLKRRRNIILSTDPAFRAEGAEVAHSLSELFKLLRGTLDGVCVIGGESVYHMLLPYCDHALVTKTYTDAPADRFFPNLDVLPNWVCTAVSERMAECGTTFCYMDYVNQAPEPPDMSERQTG